MYIQEGSQASGLRQGRSNYSSWARNFNPSLNRLYLKLENLDL